MARSLMDSGFQDERLREHEFYRYYDAVRSLSGGEVPWADLYDDNAVKQHHPKSSPDHSLTAFCQLGALRIGTRRCLLFFFDQSHGYVLAEATRTLSLRDDRSHDVEDGLWLGHTMIPRGLSVCEHTVNIPAANKGSNQNEDNAHQIHIINDLTDDVRFCDRPYVLDGPKARFYAGVPIVTPNGLAIGAYCVLDDKPRPEGLSGKEVGFMTDMAVIIMTHLEMLRARTEFGRGTRMLTGLGNFVKETPVVGLQARSQRNSLSNDTTTPSTAKVDASASLDGSQRDDYFGHATDEHQTDRTKVVNGASSRSTSQKRSSTDETNDLNTDEFGEFDQATTPSTTVRAQVQLVDSGEPDGGIGQTFERAAALLRDSIEADGVLILDASVHSYGGAVMGPEHGSDSEDLETSISESGEEEALAQVDCRVLAQSRRSATVPNKTPGISEKILRDLLRRYPDGKVWSFGSDGEVASSDDVPESNFHLVEEADPQNARRASTRTKTRRDREARELQRVFPGARTVCLVGMFDNVRERFYAGGIIWTYSPIRQFTSDELSYMTAFMDVVAAKVSRIEASLKDQAKSDFISSVSHELRSPLHGILGSIDFLQEQAVLDWSMISQIEKCSSTLMDVIDHLLEFAKMNNLGQALRKIGRRDGAYGRNGLPQTPLTSNGSSLTEVVSLAKVTEEVADSIFFSHCCRVEGSPTVDLILDISVDPNLQCRLIVGAWKRLCINIIGNALKYTSKGYVLVSLKIAPPKKKRPVAILTITDSGCGMSQDFLENRLFKAFSQENELANGTGLGMSLVAKLLRGFGGKIKVQSAKGHGTVMTVTMPLDVIPQETPEPTILPPHAGLKVAILNPPRGDGYQPTKGRRLQIGAIQDISRRLHAKFVESSKEADVVFAFEDDVPALVVQHEEVECTTPVIVLCETVMSAAQLRASHINMTTSRRAEFVARPFGPVQIGAALRKCAGLEERQDASSSRSPSRAKDAQSRKLIRRQLSRRSHTQGVEPRASASARDSMSRSFSAPDLTDHDVRTESLRRAAVKQNRESDTIHHAQDNRAGEPKSSLAQRYDVSTVKDARLDNLAIRSSPAETEQKLSLLLVDDNSINLRLLTTYAEKNSHPYLTATNGLEAAQAYENSASQYLLSSSTSPIPHPRPKPQVIFMDIQMPLMDGYTSARRIRSFEAANGISPPVIIVAVTGLASNQSQQLAYASGIDMFLTKPVRPRDITRVLEAIEGEGRMGGTMRVNGG